MSKILVLGHKGMLGRAVVKYLTQAGYLIETTETRWGEPQFEEMVNKSDAEFIINCIGKIPQKKPAAKEYESLNFDLPVFLESTSKKIIHPSTDCEFSGELPPKEVYTKTSKRDAVDTYGQSKAKISAKIENEFKNTKIIRTSIIGHENSTSLSLLDWFLSQSGEINGFTNHFWNGITTLEWAKNCVDLINNWDNAPVLNQLGTKEHYSKFDILSLAKDVYEKDIVIKPFSTTETINKCLESDVLLPDLKYQLKELKNFFATS